MIDNVMINETLAKGFVQHKGMLNECYSSKPKIRNKSKKAFINIPS